MKYESEYYGVTSLTGTDTIQHYGVMGMKWGQRKYQNADGSLTSAGKKHYADTGEYGYHYKSWGTKHNERKAAKMAAKASKAKTEDKRAEFTAKSKEFQRRAGRSAELDRREQAYASKQSAGRNLGARLLTNGAVGGKSYQQMLAMMNETRSGVTGKKVAAAVLASYGGRVLSTGLKAAYIRGTGNDFSEVVRNRKNN